MKVKLNDKQMRAIAYEEDLIIEGEIWECIEQDGDAEEDEDARYETFIYQRPSDKKYFRIAIAYARYGYKDYGYEDFLQDYFAYEVEKKEIKKVVWSYVK